MLLPIEKENGRPPLWTHSHQLEDLAQEMGHHRRPVDSTDSMMVPGSVDTVV